MHLNTSGLIDSKVYKLYDAATGTVTESVRVNEKETHSVWYGTVAAKDEENFLLTTESGTVRCIPLNAARYVTVYDLDAKSGEDMFRIGTAGEVPKGAQVLIYVRSGECYDIALFE